MSLTFYDLPNDIIRDILCHYLDPKDTDKQNLIFPYTQLSADLM